MGGFPRLICKILHLKSVQSSHVTVFKFTRKAAKTLLALWPMGGWNSQWMFVTSQSTFFCEILDSYQILLSATISDVIVSDTHYGDPTCGTLITLLCPWVPALAHFLMFPTRSTQGQFRHFICISSIWEILLTHIEIKSLVSCRVCLPWCVPEWSWGVIKLIGDWIYFFYDMMALTFGVMLWISEKWSSAMKINMSFHFLEHMPCGHFCSY